MNYENNIGKYLIDKTSNQGCFIGYLENGIYRCTSWQPVADMFSGSIQSLQDTGYSVALNANDVAKNPNLVIQNSPSTQVVGFENIELPNGIIDGVNKVFSLSYDYRPGSLMVYEDGLLLATSGNDYSESGSNQFTLTNPPPVGTLLLVQAAKQ